MSGKKSILKAMFSLENSISAENIVEAQREALLQISRRLDTLAATLASRPSKSALKTLSEETLAIRREVLNALQAFLDRCRPALTPEQYSVASKQVSDYLEQTPSQQTGAAQNEQAEPLELLNLEADSSSANPAKPSGAQSTASEDNTSSNTDKKDNTASEITSASRTSGSDSETTEALKERNATTTRSDALKADLSRPLVPKPATNLSKSV